jgi:uncharacterized protein (DUF983 family)
VRRAHWTADFAEANIVAGLLRANGINAWVFDAGMASLDWRRTLAIGGYRIMVVDADVVAAQELVTTYRKGGLELPDAETDQPTCPRCGARRNEEDQRPRRAIFLWLIIGVFPLSGLFFVFRRVLRLPFTVLYLVLVFALTVFLIHWMKRRYRCASCANTWQARTNGFTALSHAVDSAETANTHSAPHA